MPLASAAPAAAGNEHEAETLQPLRPPIDLLPSRELLEEKLRSAKEYGIYISLSEDNKKSGPRRKLILQFLEDLQELKRAEIVQDEHARAIVERAGTIIRSILVDDLDEENEDDDEIEDEDENEDGNQDGGGNEDGDEDEPENSTTPDNTEQEVSRLKRKGYNLNPVCKNCKM